MVDWRIQLESILTSTENDTIELGHRPRLANLMMEQYGECRMCISLIEWVREEVGPVGKLFSLEQIQARIVPGRALREHGKNLPLGDPRDWLKAIARLMNDHSTKAPPISGADWETDPNLSPSIELNSISEWLTLELLSSKGKLRLGPDNRDCRVDAAPHFFAFAGWPVEGGRRTPKDFIFLPINWHFTEEKVVVGPSWLLFVLYVLDRMAEAQSLRNTANEWDDWGEMFDPNRLATLKNLGTHLGAEEDYYKDPTRRPRLRFELQKPRNPWRDTLQSYLQRQRCPPKDLEKLAGADYRTFNDLAGKDLDPLRELGIQLRTVRLLQSAIERMPPEEEWHKWCERGDIDYFRIVLDTSHLQGTGTNFLHDDSDSVRIEIEELAEKRPKRNAREFRVEVHWYDEEEGVVHLRPDTWQKPQRQRWRSEAPRKGHLRLAADTYQTFRKQQAVNILEHKKQDHGRTLAQVLRNASGLSEVTNLPSVAPFNPDLLHDDETGGVARQLGSISLGIGCLDLGMIRGPPGTGKTTVICEIIQQLVSQGKRVLMVAPTHVAVDNVLERIGLEASPLFRPGVYPMRQGRKHKVDPDLREFTWDELHIGLRNRLARQLEKGLSRSQVKEGTIVSGMQRRWLDHLRKPLKKGEDDLLSKLLRLNLNVVCGTTIGISSGALSDMMEIPFDVAICDEASKATLGEFLVPAVRARRWLLVGDEMQLSPYVERRKLQFIIGHVLWKHFILELKPRKIKGYNGKEVEQPGKEAWVPGLTVVKNDRSGSQGDDPDELIDPDGNLEGFFAMRKSDQEMFFEAGKDIEVQLKQWFDNRLGWALMLRNFEDRIFVKVLCLRAELVDEWKRITYEKAMKKWRDTCKRIDEANQRAVEQWKHDCQTKRKEYEKQVEAHRRRKEEITKYPDMVAELRAKAEDSDSFTPPPRPEPLPRPGRLLNPPLPKPKRQPEPPEPKMPSEAPRPKANPQREPRSDPFKKYYWVPETRDWWSYLWKKLVMISEFEYKSAFELLIGKLKVRGRDGTHDRIVTLTVQYRMHPTIAKFNSEVVYGGKYLSAPATYHERGFQATIASKPLRKEDSLVWLDTSLFKGEAIEVKRTPGNRHLMENVAEAKVIVQTLQDLEVTFRNLKPPADQSCWTVGVIAFYSAQARLICRALAETNTFRRISRTRFLFANEMAEVEVDVVDRFQGKERDVIFLSFTRANTRGSLGFLTVLNRLNVATTRGRHKLFIVGHRRQLRDMTEKAARYRKRDAEAFLAEKEAPQDFVTKLLDYVEEHGSTISIDPRRLSQDWKGVPLLEEIGPANSKKPAHRKGHRRRRRK